MTGIFSFSIPCLASEAAPASPTAPSRGMTCVSWPDHFSPDPLNSPGVTLPSTEAAMNRIPVNPPSIREPFARYSHGLLVEAPQRMLFASGQLGIGPDDAIPEDVEAQAVLCFENIRAILAAAAMDFSHVVRFTGFVTDRAHFPVYGAVRSRYVSGNAYASTLVIVSGFTRPEFKVEVEVTAIA